MPSCGNGQPSSENELEATHVVYPYTDGSKWQGEAVSTYVSCIAFLAGMHSFQ